MMTEFQKRIYNSFLRAYRINNNQPFRSKKDFSNIENEKLNELVKLEKFFAKHPHLFSNDYFDAPYKLYNEEKKYYSLKYYASYKGMSTCLEYFKLLQSSDPEKQIDYLKQSLKFIAEFCIEKNISLDSYVKYKSVCQYDCLIHLKEHKISWYCVFGIPKLFDVIYDLPSDEFELYFGTNIDMNDIKNKFDKSQRAKELFREGLKKIDLFVKKKLKYDSK